MVPKSMAPNLAVPRGCTDIICCVLLVVAIVGYVVVGVVGTSWGVQGGPARPGGALRGLGASGRVVTTVSSSCAPQPGPTGTLGR